MKQFPLTSTDATTSNQIIKPRIEKSNRTWINPETALPFEMSLIGLITNPSNTEELLLLGSQDNNDIHTYNMTSKKFTKIGQIDFLENKMKVSQVVAIQSGTINTCIILFGTYDSDRGEFYAVFDTKTNKFTFCKHYIPIDDKFIFHNNGCQSLIFENWLFISGGFAIECRSKISIFQLNKKTNAILNNGEPVFLINLPKEYCYLHHALLLLSNEKDFKNNKIALSLLLFGGIWQKFNESFLIVNVNLPLDYDCEKGIKNINGLDDSKKTKLHGDIEYELNEDAESIFFGGSDESNVDESNISESKDCDNNINYNTNHKYDHVTPMIAASDDELKLVYQEFGYHLINDRYLLIIDPPRIFCFDCHVEQWYTHVLTCEIASQFATALIFCGNDDDNKKNDGDEPEIMKNMRKCSDYSDMSLYIMGGKTVDDGATGIGLKKSCQNFKLHFVRPMDWDIERQIWIAFEKNRKNKKCLFATLPKVIVRKILYLCQECFFETQ